MQNSYGHSAETPVGSLQYTRVQALEPVVGYASSVAENDAGNRKVLDERRDEAETGSPESTKLTVLDQGRHVQPKWTPYSWPKFFGFVPSC